MSRLAVDALGLKLGYVILPISPNILNVTKRTTWQKWLVTNLYEEILNFKRAVMIELKKTYIL